MKILQEQVTVDFDNLSAHDAAFANFDAGYCCLGSRPASVTREQFYKVDHDYVVGAATLAKKHGCAQFHLITAAGSRLNALMYSSRVKAWFPSTTTKIIQFL